MRDAILGLRMDSDGGNTERALTHDPTFLFADATLSPGAVTFEWLLDPSKAAFQPQKTSQPSQPVGLQLCKVILTLKFFGHLFQPNYFIWACSVCFLIAFGYS